MAPSFFCRLPTIKADRLEELYTVHGVNRAVIVDLASTSESPKAVRDGYGGRISPSLRHVGCPNFLRHLLALLVKAREEGLFFGLAELRHLVLMKQNNQNPGTFLMSPRPGRQIIQGVPYRGQNWREEFFVFRIDEASVGSSELSRLPRYWAEDIGELLFGIFSFPNFCMRGQLLIDFVFFFICSSSFEEIRNDRWALGLIGDLRRGRSDCSSFDHSRVRAALLMPGGSGVAPEIAGASEDEAEHSQEEVEAPSSNPPPSDRLERQLARRSSFRTSRTSSASKVVNGLPPILIVDSDDEGAPCGRQSPVSLSPGLQDDSIVAVRKQRRLSKAARMRSADCRPPSLVSPGEEEANVKVVSASSNVCFADLSFNEFTVTMEDRIGTLRNEGEVEKGKAKETNPELSSEFKSLKEKLNEHSKQLEQSAEKLSQLESENLNLRDENQALNTASNKKRRFRAQVRPMPTLETPNSGTDANLPPTASGGDTSTREKARDAQTYDVEDSESEPEPNKEAPDGATKAESPMVVYLEQMFTKRLYAMQSMVERLPGSYVGRFLEAVVQVRRRYFYRHVFRATKDFVSEFFRVVGGTGCVRTLDQSLGLQPAVLSIRGACAFRIWDILMSSKVSE
ncbi:hypothetical protein F2Q69_00052554 [Brassica cretica]|uniref:Uncharacterized protein n=1 Tax=Brassica cretica TaxID=69181 RepID=A0A8S9MNB4_BRACR|nr:hypothetical protein F2Q69_00052554 [Brassica cretica]